MQLAIVEYARNVCGLEGAHSVELDPATPYPVIDLMPDQNGIEDIGGTLRLGSYPCVLSPDSLACRLYGTATIAEQRCHGAKPHIIFTSDRFYVACIVP